MSHSRSSNNLAYPDDDVRSDGGPQRWDRERFERMRARSRGPSGPSRSSRESLSYEESDRYSRGGERSSYHYDYEDEEQRYSGMMPERERERAPRRPDRYYYDEDDRAPPARSRPAFLDERVDVSGRELMRREREGDSRSSYEKTDVDVHIRESDRERERQPSRRPPRPAASTTGSSEGGRVRHDERENINLEINIQPPPAPAPPPPRREYYDPGPRYPRPPPPPAPRRYYDEFEEEDIRYRRERDRSSYRKSFESSESFEEIEVAPKRDPRFKRGKTRMPKRLVNKRAIVELGCPFEEEEFFYVVQVALGKDQIDEVIRISETYKETETVKKTLQLEAPPPKHHEPAPPQEETMETKKTLKIIENPTPSELAHYRRMAEKAEANGGVVIEGDGFGGEEEEEEQEVEVNETSSTTTTGRSGASKTTTRSKETSSKTSSATHATAGASGKRGRAHARPRGEEFFEETQTKTVEEDDYETETRRNNWNRGSNHHARDADFHERFQERHQEFEEEEDFRERMRDRDFHERDEVEYDTQTVVGDYKLGAPMTMVVREPPRHHLERDIKAEIRALEEERALATARIHHRDRGRLSLVEDEDFDVVRVEKRRDKSKSRHRSKSRRRSILGERLRSKSRHREPWVDNAVLEGDYDYEIVERKDSRDLFGGRRKSFVEDKDVEVRFDTTERRDRGRGGAEVVDKVVEEVKVDEEIIKRRAKSRDRKGKLLAETAVLSLT